MRSLGRMKTLENELIQYGWTVRLLGHVVAMVCWALAIALIQMLGMLAIVMFFTSDFECYPHYESANNAGGWLIASTTILMPLPFGWMFRKYVTLFWLVCCASVQTYLFVYQILNWGGC